MGTQHLTDADIRKVMEAQDFERHCANPYWPIKFARAVLAADQARRATR